MSNNDRSTCILKIEQCGLACEKIIVYLADVLEVMKEDEKKFQRQHRELNEEIEITVQITLELQNALGILRSKF